MKLLLTAVLLALAAVLTLTACGSSQSAEAFQLGMDYHSDREYEKTIEQFTEAIRLDPQHALSYYFRGVAYRNLGEVRRAIQDYDEAQGYGANRG